MCSNEELTKTTDWKIVTNQHGTILHVTCPLCGHELTHTKDTFLLQVDDDDRRLHYVGDAIERCLRRHLGRDEDYFDAVNKRTCTSVVQVKNDEWDNCLILAHDGRYWIETYRYHSRFDAYDFELKPITSNHAEWLNQLLTAQAELIRKEQATHTALLAMIEWNNREASDA